MSLAEFGFVSLTPGQSARYDWTDTNSDNYKKEQQKKKEEKERKERAAREEAERKKAEEEAKKRKEEEEAARLAEEERQKEEELAKLHQPWWKKYADSSKPLSKKNSKNDLCTNNIECVMILHYN